MKKLLQIILLSVIVLMNGCSVPKTEPTPIHTLFYQPLLKDKIDWDDSFQKMRDCKIERLILQWSRFGVVDFVKNDKWLVEILENAQKYNIKVVVGLYGDDRYFKVLENRDTDIEAYLQTLLEINTLQAQKIYTIAKEYTIFEGWYIYDEIDDTNFKSSKRQTYLKAYLQSLAKSLNGISQQSLYISGYFSNHMTPQEYVKMFSYITQKQYTVLVQSGIGAKLVNADNSRRYMQEFKRNFKGAFIPIVEGFTFVDSKPTAIGFTALQQQIELLKTSSNIEQVALFSLRYFFDKKLMEKYQENYSN